MQRTIEIYDQDAYRAKTESKFCPGIFFEEVYKRTDAIVCDIIEQMEIYSEDSTKHGHKAKYRGMGNNIVVFCADRGQGKTSAMQSYAAYLQNRSSVDKQFFTKNSAVDRAHFIVLDPIDPSSLDSGESIIRVLVSRLFLEFSDIAEKDKFPYKDEISFRKEKDDILKAFQNCYENIDYLQKGTYRETYDLETLAQLGNSAELKRNLYTLVKHFLDVVLCENDNKASYLVVQIDDADLSMGDIFKICDDIRNYFSIPNIIVMMATNYAQLELAICQRYMKQYEHLIRLQERAGFEEECNRMAFRYLEKMLPAGHRVVLPSVDVMMHENADLLKLLYYRYRKERAPEEASFVEIFASEIDCGSEESQCRNMQQQLIKILYMKTGIILLERSGEIHPMLPHTLRELTHFIKLLDDMERIDQRKAFSERKSTEIEKWKRNLDILKRYFLNYWCGTHLSYRQQKLMEEIDSANRRKESVCQSIRKYIGSGMEAAESRPVTYRDIIRLLEAEGLKDESILQNAIFFYYTIVLNEWFVRAAESPNQLGLIAEFTGNPLDVSMKSGGADKYNILQFDFEGERIREYVQDELTNTLNAAWLSLFCADVSDNIEKPIEEGRLTGEREVKLRFDLFRPVMAMLDSATGLTKSSEKRAGDSSASDSDEDKNSQEQYLNSNVGHLISAKNVIANYDIQSWVRRKIQKKIDEWEKGDERRIDKIWEEFYEIIDSWVDNEPYLAEESTLRNVCFGENLGNSTIGDIVFLCNDDNRKKYIQEYRKHLSALINRAIDKASALQKKAEEEAAEVSLKQMIGEIKSYPANREIILSMEGKQPSGQFLQKIADLNVLIEIRQQFEAECNILLESQKEDEESVPLKTRIDTFLFRVRRYKKQLRWIPVL